MRLRTRVKRAFVLLSAVVVGVLGFGAAIIFAQNPATWTAGGSTTGTANGVTLKTGASDSPVGAPVTAAPCSGQATQMPAAGGDRRYLYYDVNTSSFPQGFTFARIVVEYVDETAFGGSQLLIEYDAMTAAFQASEYHQMLGSGQCQTATFDLTDVRFQN